MEERPPQLLQEEMMMMPTTTSISSDPMMRMQRQREKRDLQRTTKRRPKVSLCTTQKFVWKYIVCLFMSTLQVRFFNKSRQNDVIECQYFFHFKNYIVRLIVASKRAFIFSTLEITIFNESKDDVLTAFDRPKSYRKDLSFLISLFRQLLAWWLIFFHKMKIFLADLTWILSWNWIFSSMQHSANNEWLSRQ